MFYQFLDLYSFLYRNTYNLIVGRIRLRNHSYQICSMQHNDNCQFHKSNSNSQKFIKLICFWLLLCCVLCQKKIRFHIFNFIFLIIFMQRNRCNAYRCSVLNMNNFLQLCLFITKALLHHLKIMKFIRVLFLQFFFNLNETEQRVDLHLKN